MTALENVMIPLHFKGNLSKRARKRKAMELLRLVKLDERADHTPSELSGGEQQRVAIARAFANDPEIVLLDEPTGDLDSKTGIEVLNLLRDLNRKGATFISVTHDTAVADYGTRLVQIRDGKMISGKIVEADGLKETKESRQERLEKQKKCRDQIERETMQFVRHIRKENILEIRLDKIRESCDPEAISFLPLHYFDLVGELLEKGEINGKVNNDVLYLDKKSAQLDLD